MKEKAVASAAGALAVGVALMVLPAFIAGLAVYWRAWARGWSPTRVRFIAAGAWLLPVVTWVGGSSPWQLVDEAGDLAESGPVLMAWLPLLPWMVPLGVLGGALFWSRRWFDARAGRHRNPRAAGVWGERQWQHAMTRARKEARRPLLVPATDRRGDFVIGRAASVSEAGAGKMIPPDPRRLTLPADALGHHVVVVGEPGAGKTVMLEKLMWVWTVGTWRRHVVGASDRPLLILVNCKGGSEAGGIVDGFVKMNLDVGIPRHRIGVWPQEDRLDLWSLPAPRLTEVLVEMLKTEQPYYASMQDNAIHLAVAAPCGPPTSSVDFVSRLDIDWLLGAWDHRFPGERQSIKELKTEITTVAAQYRGLFRRLGRQLDSGRPLDDFDAIVCTVEGTRNAVTAAAQAQALVELVAELAASGGRHGRRRVQLVVDEFSAVSERVSMTNLMERGRSLGVGVIPAGQSWASLGATPDDRKRLVSAAGGGMLLMATTDPEDLVQLAGSQLVVEIGKKQLETGEFGDEGTGRVQNAYLVNPDRLRLQGAHKGQVAYVSHGTVTWGVVAPVEVTTSAPQLALPGRRLYPVIERVQAATITAGNRIEIAELDAGLSKLEAESGDDEDEEV